MKKKLTLIAFLLTLCTMYSQIGINTTTIQDGLILEVHSQNKGIMIPTININSRTNQAPLIGNVPTGTLVFNKRNFGSFPNEVHKNFYWWDNENKVWMPFASSLENVTCQFKNQESSINFHAGPIGTYQDMDLFANLFFSENFDVYQKLSPTTLKINKSGVYTFTINLDMLKTDSNNDPVGLSTRILVNNSPKGTIQYWRSQENENELSHHFTEYFEINEGDEIRIQTARSTTSNSSRQIKLTGPNKSNITIQRIR